MKWEGKDRDGDRWEVETSSTWEILSLGLRNGEGTVFHSYTINQARALIDALTKAVEQVEAQQAKESEFDLLSALRDLVKQAEAAR